MPNGITPEDIVNGTDEEAYLPKRAEMAVAITFDDRLSADDRAKIQQRVKDVLEAAMNDGQLIPPYSRLPRPRLVGVQPLHYRCEHCQEVVSPFAMMGVTNIA